MIIHGHSDSQGLERVLRVDKSTNSLQTIEYAHHEIHSGSSFSAHYSLTTASTDDHRTGIGFTTPAGLKWPHMTIEVTASDPAELFFLEGPTLDADPGTNVVVYNRNRNSDNEATIGSLEATPTANEITTLTEAQIGAATFSGGTELEYMLLAGGGGPKAVGGSARGSQEWILQPSTKYMIYLQNVGANANTHVIHIDWYEHTNN